MRELQRPKKAVGVSGLFQANGLIEESLIPGMFDDIANYIKNGAGSDLPNAARNAAKAGANALKDKFNSMLPVQISIATVTVGGGSVMGRDIPRRRSAGSRGPSSNSPRWYRDRPDAHYRR